MSQSTGIKRARGTRISPALSESEAEADEAFF
jgi:hypothetical protein